MGSRHARRFGRTAAVHSVKKPKLAISKAQKHANRAQHKASVLAAARQTRKAVERQAPYLMAVFPLVEMTNLRINAVLSVLQSAPVDNGSHPFEIVAIRREGGRKRDILLAALDMAKVADIILIVFDGRFDMDDTAIEIIDAVRAQGLPSVFALAVGEGSRDGSMRKLRGRQLVAESLGDEHTLRPIAVEIDGHGDASDVNRTALRRILSKSPHQVAWRARYGYMLVDSAFTEPRPTDSSVCTLSLHGWVRGRGFSANELVHITGFGSFAVSQIIDAESGKILSERNEATAEPVESKAEVDETMGEQTWPPEVDDDDNNDEAMSRDEDDNSNRTSAEPFTNTHDEIENIESNDNDDCVKHGTDDHVEDEDDMELDEKDNRPINVDDLENARHAAKTDMEFPDEVDTPLDTPARVRFARFRGLKSLRTGEWDPKEQLPREYASLFQFRNLAATRKHVFAAAGKEAEAVETFPDSNFAQRGKKVAIRLKDVPYILVEKLLQQLKNRVLPTIASGMLKHENRRSVVHFSVRRADSFPDDEIIKAKSHLEMHCGFVRFDGRPMFSENNANSDKHKMERYLVAGRHIVVSFYGPAVYAPAPALLCRVDGSVIAHGSALGADPDRIILKRIILTGYPLKTQKKKTVVRFMFFNPDDVRWFKPVELWTKLGRSGHIIEPLGTHGHMKCRFDNVVLHHDTVCMTLYKRVYPKLIAEETE